MFPVRRNNDFIQQRAGLQPSKNLSEWEFPGTNRHVSHTWQDSNFLPAFPAAPPSLFCVLGEWYSLKTWPKNKLMQFWQELWHVETTQRGQTRGFQRVSRLLLWPDIYRGRALLFLRGAVGMKKKKKSDSLLGMWHMASPASLCDIWHSTQKS